LCFREISQNFPKPGGVVAAGTAGGGWKIIKTLGMKLAHLKPVHGFAVETAAATVIEGASFLGLPLSTTHVISSTIMGVGASKRFSAVKWGVGGSIVMAWALTPACLRRARLGAVQTHYVIFIIQLFP